MVGSGEHVRKRHHAVSKMGGPPLEQVDRERGAGARAMPPPAVYDRRSGLDVVVG
jgi:hypothetical protein